MKFDSDIVTESLNTFIDYLTDPNKYQKYSFEMPEGFNDVPVLEQVRAHSELMVEPDKIKVGERIARIMVNGKPVEVFLENVSLGKFIMNGKNEWDVLPVIKQHPFALNSLIEVCIGDFLGKYMPPLRNIKEVQAEVKT
jgi:hypothetical protein